MQNVTTNSEPPAANGWQGRERIAGLVLVALGGLGLWGGSDLPFMTSDGVGSGLMPRILSLLILGLGALQIVLSLKDPGPSTGHWAIRETIPVVLGVILFAVTIRGYPLGPIAIPSLGMAVACPLAIIASGLAARDSRLPELLFFAVVLTAFCIGLFRYALGLSVPVAPWLLGY
jgi:Tripartite tricarboxylate transporter TctB family